MPALITARIDDHRVMSALAGLRAGMRNMRPFFVNVGEELVDETKNVRFPSQTDPEGRPWQRLKPQTIARKKRNKNKILREHGPLQDTIHYDADSGRVRVGTVRVYGAIHQFGGAIRRRSGPLQRTARSGREHFARRAASQPIQMPARPYLGISDRMRGRIMEIAQDFLRKAARR